MIGLVRLTSGLPQCADALWHAARSRLAGRAHRTILPPTKADGGGRLAAAGREGVLRERAVEWRASAVVVTQLALVMLSNYCAFALRFESRIPPDEFARLTQTLPWLVAVRGTVFLLFRMYDSVWKYTGISEIYNVVVAVASSSAVFWISLALLHVHGYSRSIVLIDALLLIVLLTGIRMSKQIAAAVCRAKGAKRVLIFGAGDAGEMIVRDMQSQPCGYEPVGFLDDDPAKFRQRIHGVPVLGNRDDLARVIAAKRPHEVLVAMPGADPSIVRGIVELLRPFRMPITTLPSVRDIIGGRVAVTQIRDLTVEDLLARAPVNLNVEPVRNLITGRSVLITGAGGSIGSELSRQIAALHPSSLVLYERSEHALYCVSNDLTDRFGSTGVHPVIGDVTDAGRVNQVFERHRPDIVFHAAAHKHVPLMEHNPCEAVKNNVVGTALMTAAADSWAVERFILISTDKAVNPSSVMGATKRVCERIVQRRACDSATRFATVRFGNVLGSNGSVLPRFLEQIRAGGPVTVTHPDIRRYFMLVGEAVQLVLHAAALGERGVVYVLDMGEQIRLVELARDVIRCAGFVPGIQIPIVFIGLRPGEKLSEELVGTDETAIPSSVPKILRVSARSDVDFDGLEPLVAELVTIAQHGDAAGVVRQLRTILPSFEPMSEDPAPIVVEPAAIQIVHQTLHSRDDRAPSLAAAMTADADA
jgi:FlaA1/EpsC-like NDP-sugar epimerase